MIRFGPFQLDSKSHELRRDDRVISLRPKSFQLLTYMAEHPGRLLTKDELLDAGWGKTAVSDGVLKVCIWEIREALGDDPAEPRYVQTVHRAGYRFIEAKPHGTTQGDSGVAFGRPVQYAKSGDVHIIGRDQVTTDLPEWQHDSLASRESARRVWLKKPERMHGSAVRRLW